MGTNDLQPDKIIEELGGCGRYQWRLNVIVHIIKAMVCFSINTMVIIAKTPTWTCADDLTCNHELTMLGDDNSTTTCPTKACTYVNSSTPCSSFAFEDSPYSIVNEFQLVCGRNFIPTTMMTIQVAGTLAGNLVAGQLGDLFGRKPPFFFSILITCVFNIVGFFAVNWVMLAVVRFFLGLAAGFFLTIQYSLLSEFSLAKWRVWVIGFPSWPIEACVFVLLAWLIQDWRYIQLMIGILSATFLFTWWCIPESFRWYIANDRPDKAKEIILGVAKYNRKEVSGVDHLTQKHVEQQGHKYTFIDLLKSGKLRKIMVLLAIQWVTLGIVAYGISYGVQALSGNLFFNVFLFNMVGIPSKAIALWLQNRFGRRATAVMCFLTVAIGCFAVGIVQSIDAPNKDALTNGFALFAYIGITTAWGPVQTMTIENFPTVVRAIGFGSLSIFGRAAAMVGPQLVYVELFIPGIMYYVCGAIATIAIMSCFFLPETKGGHLQDKIHEKDNKINNINTQEGNNHSV